MPNAPYSLSREAFKVVELESLFSALVVAHVQGPARLADCTRDEAQLLHFFLILPPQPTGAMRHSLAFPPTTLFSALRFCGGALACKGLCSSSVSLACPPTSHEMKKTLNLGACFICSFCLFQQPLSSTKMEITLCSCASSCLARILENPSHPDCQELTLTLQLQADNTLTPQFPLSGFHSCPLLHSRHNCSVADVRLRIPLRNCNAPGPPPPS